MYKGFDPYNYNKRPSTTVRIGKTPLGSLYPIRIQSMANCSTMDTEKCVEQTISIIQAGADYFRFTTQGTKEARNLANIKQSLCQRGYNIPLVADIHFNAEVAEVAAQIVEKVRINPGNYVDRLKTFQPLEYTDQEYKIELQKIASRFIPFIQLCRQHGTAIRIGVNHGSLSDRIMSRYGDTPIGMVESCMEFLRICQQESFPDVVISIKASNTKIMVETVRLLVETMEKEKISFPLHLGVTEAGSEEEGRIKSAVGIGALLSDGIGDTIRVSLSESPEKEIPVALLLTSHMTDKAKHPKIECNHNWEQTPFDPRSSSPLVIVPSSAATKADYFYDPHTYTLQNQEHTPYPFIKISIQEITHIDLNTLREEPDRLIILESSHINKVGEFRAGIAILRSQRITNPIILSPIYCLDQKESLQIIAGADLGSFFLDKKAGGLMIQAPVSPLDLSAISFGILQASRARITQTEYISCPGCGRTLFDLEKTIQTLKSATSHLTHLKIGIMGCIVNGPGEMADADYGYVGAGKGKISLYKGKTCIEKNIDQEKALEKLITIIKENNDWSDPST